MDELNQRLLWRISDLPDVMGSFIVGQNGRPIANRLPPEYDPETVGFLSLGIYVNAANSIRQIAHNRLHQLVARTEKGFLIIAEWRGLNVVVLSDRRKTSELIPLMRSLTQLLNLDESAQ